MFLKKRREKRPECPLCRGPMEEGAVMERGSGVRPQQVWVPAGGAPEPRPGELHASPRRGPLPVRALRCPSCGFLAFYAS